MRTDGTTPNTTLDTPNAPADETQAAGPDAQAAQLAADAAALGIQYTERFTLLDAYESFNSTRRPITLPDGQVIPAERQRMNLGPEFFARHHGEFELRRAGLADDIKLRVFYDRTSEGVAVSPATAWLINATAVAKHLLVDWPKWFNVEAVDNHDVLYMIHHWFTEWDARFRGVV